jgi:PAS domain S-box-containing protein
VRDTFLRSGEVGRDLLAVDWASTALGTPDRWPGSLQAVVRMVLSSRFSMWMAWGEDLTFFCNDAYRRDTLGTKYPWALGKPAATVWSEIWPDIGPRIDRVMTTGEATWDEKLLLFLERSGYREETYHTFSYSPLADNSGAVAGMLCVVSEDTEEVISRRRMGTLHDAGARSAAQLTEAETVSAVSRALESSPLDLPFHLLYLEDADGVARLAGRGGFTGSHAAAPATLDLDAADAAWPRPGPVGNLPLVVEGLRERFPGLPSGGWTTPPTRAAVLPIPGAHSAAYGVLVVGLNPFRPFDDSYADFLQLVAAQFGTALTDARAYEFERQRAETLARLDQAKTDFFTNVSHEFRTPLTLLLGPTDDALADTREPLPPAQRERLTVVQRNGLRLLKLVNTLLDFSRLESGRVNAAFEPVDLSRYTRELTSMFETAAGRLGLTLRVESPVLPSEVHVDRDLWGKIVLNLLSNALKFTLEGGVTVAVTADGDDAVLSVRDTGAGIPAAELPHLFERFHRVSGARSRTHEGSGIGLALVAELVELHGGSVGVTSEVGVGSCFEVRVPFGTDHLPAAQVVEPTSREVARQVVDGFLAEATQFLDDGVDRAVAAPPAGDRPRVLVVDDNADIRHYVSALLEEHYDVETALDGQDGLDRALANPPDLVLTDVMMPRLNGFELLAALQEDPATVGTPVLMLSARAGEDGTLQGLEAGADDYLVKPFTARELLARVRANLELDRARRTRLQLERSQMLLDQAQQLARLGSWEIDLASGRVEASDEFRRILGRGPEELEELGFPALVTEIVHPDDRALVLAAIEGARAGSDLRYEVRVLRPDGTQVYISVHGVVVDDSHDGSPRLRGSVQDVTERRDAAEALARAKAATEVAAREHEIADALQRSLLPERSFDLRHLEVATYYRAGVAGTQVGGDWYDVIELGESRTALVVGDVMGRGVAAAAIMGQVRAAVRAYARLGLPPAVLLESVDAVVRDLAPDQIVTCVYAVFDPADLVLRFANAGHLPLLVRYADGSSARLGGEPHPPLGVGTPFTVTQEVHLPPGASVLLYTDGLVERRGEDLEAGIESLLQFASALDVPLEEMPEALVRSRLPEGVTDDDVAVLVARVPASLPVKDASDTP